MKNEILNTCDQLVAAAANGVYQGIIITILVALCLRWLGRTNAATRHAVWFCTLLLLAALVVAHCLVDSASLRHMTANDTVPSSTAELTIARSDAVVPLEIGTTTGSSSRSSDNFRDDLPNDWEEQPRSGQHPLLALIQTRHDSVEEVSEVEQSSGIGPAHTENDVRLASNIFSETTGFSRLIERLLNPMPVELALGSWLPKFASMALLALWLTIAGFRVCALLFQLARIQKLKRQSIPPDAELSRLFQNLSDHLVTKRKVELRVSPVHRSSFLLGFLHPVVLLPAEERMELAEAELVLRHELAHLDRRDDWVNLIQHFLLAVFFFHPAFWWMSKQLSLEREIACDDHVLQQSKRPQTYALVLANLAARMQKQFPLLAPGSSNNKTQLKERINMILNTHRNASPRPAKAWLALITSAAALAAVAIICAAPRIVLAQSEATTAVAAVAPPANVQAVVSVNDVVPVVTVTELPHPGSTDIAPPTPPPPAMVGAGPKFKSGGPVIFSTPPAVIAAPVVSLSPVTTRLSVTAAVPGQPTPILAAIEAPPEPKAPRAPWKVQAPVAGNGDSSLEERLDRLERMVNSLMNQLNPKGRANIQLKLEKQGMIDRKEMAKIEALAKQQAELASKISPQEIEKIKEQAEREARRAIEQARRATAEFEKARKSDQRQAVEKLKADSQRHLEDLRRQVEALERQREKLDREIERLEQDQEDPDEQDEDSAATHNHSSESKSECVTESSAESSATR